MSSDVQDMEVESDAENPEIGEALERLTVPAQSSTFDCSLDWDGDGVAVNDAGDLRLCFDAAKARAGSANDGTGRAVVVLIPEGTYDLSTGGWILPYTLTSGMTLRGVFPRLKWQGAPACAECGQPPDLDMQPNGGTWLNVNNRTKTLFTAKKSRGIVIENIGATNFGTFFTAGGDNIDGASFTRFSNLYLLGVSSSVDNQNNLVGIECYNCQHNFMDHINLYRLDTGIHWVSQNCWWQPSNSVWSDVWMVTRRATTSPGFWFEAKPATQDTSRCPAAMLGEGLNYITMIRPHVSAFTHLGLPGSAAFRFDGNGASIYGFTLIGIDLEGSSEVGILANGNVQGLYLNFAGCTGNTTVADVKFQGGMAEFNSVDSRCTNLKLYTDSSTNMVNGHISRILPGSQKPIGLYRTYADGNVYQSSGLASFSAYRTGITGAVKEAGINITPFFGSSDTVNRPAFHGILDQPGLSLATGGARADFIGVQSAPYVFGTAANADLQNFFGVNSAPRLDSTGIGTRVTTMSGLRSAPELAGSNYALSELSYFRADSGGARSLPPGVTVANVYGLLLPDLMGSVGSASREIARIEAQTGQIDGSRSNFRFYGGDWNTGHLRLGSGHFWYDDINNRFRVSEGAPTFAAGGRTVVTGSSVDTYGVLLWGNPATGQYVTGQSVCAAAGMTCVDTSDFSAMNVSIGCATTHANGKFAVQCK
jgi:hypothetical protein